MLSELSAHLKVNMNELKKNTEICKNNTVQNTEICTDSRKSTENIQKSVKSENTDSVLSVQKSVDSVDFKDWF